MNKLCEVRADHFHFRPGIGIAVWNTVNDLIQVIVFFDDIEAGTEINITEICDIRYPVIHSSDAVRGIDALIFEHGIIHNRSDFLCTDFFS